MPQYRFKFSAATNDAASGTNAWTNPNNALAPDSTYANGNIAAMEWLKLTGVTWVDPAPDASESVVGIGFVVRGFWTNTGTALVGKMVRSSALGNTMAGTPPATFPNTAPQFTNYGGATDLWGYGDLTIASLDANFGFAIGAGTGSIAPCEVDYIEGVVYTSSPLAGVTQDFNLPTLTNHWVDTGLTVANGQTFTVWASAKYSPSTTTWDGSTTAFPEGTYSDTVPNHKFGDAGLFAPGAGAPTVATNIRSASLGIAVEPADPGTGYASALQPNRGPAALTAPRAGKVWLGFSDGLYADNTGSMAVTINISAPVSGPGLGEYGKFSRIPPFGVK